MFVHAHMNYFLEVFAIVILYSIVLGMTIGIEGVWLAYPLAEATTFAVNMVLATVHNHRFPTRWLDMGFPAEKEVQNEKVLGDI